MESQMEKKMVNQECIVDYGGGPGLVGTNPGVHGNITESMCKWYCGKHQCCFVCLPMFRF